MPELKFKGNPQLETGRLILRKFTMQDAADIFEYASDERISQYMTWDPHKTVDDSRGFIKMIMEKYSSDEAGEWAIILKESGKLIGSLGIPWCDMKNSRAEIGYVISRNYWGQGIMPEAAGRILKFLFEEMELNRVECCHFLPNEKSGRVMQKLGMTFEGIAREKIFAKGIYWDTKQYAILRSDWMKKRGVVRYA